MERTEPEAGTETRPASGPGLSMLSMSSSVSAERRREISTSSRAERGEVEVVAVWTPASPSLSDPAPLPT